MQALRTAFIISPNMARRIISMAKRLGEIAEQLDGVAPRKRRRRTPKPKATASAIREAHAAPKDRSLSDRSPPCLTNLSHTQRRPDADGTEMGTRHHS